MKKNFIKIGVSLIGLVLLIGCEKKPEVNHAYLMTHPALLEKELRHCKTLVTEDSTCEIAKQAARDFYALITKRQEDPEAFGKIILEQQFKIASLKDVSPDQSEQLAELLAAVAATSIE